MTATATVEEISALREVVRDFLAAQSSEEAVRKAVAAGGHDARLWGRLTGELGLARLTTPESYGGDGLGFPELRVVLEEQGRALACSPYLASAVLAVQTLLAADDAGACDRYLPDIAAGSVIATVAIAEETGNWDADAVRTSARETADGWVLSGAKRFVIDGAVADLLLVAARTDAGPTLFAVEAGAAGLTITSHRVLDGTRPLAAMTVDDTPAVLVGVAGAAGPVVERVLDLGGLAVAAEQVGAARQCLERAVGYAKQREQFGRPIGSFQAIKHKLAQMLAEVEVADALTEGACLLVTEGSPNAASAAVAAYIRASTAFRFVASETIQVFGGIGFTWEHFAHLYFRRARASSNLFGGQPATHERLLKRLGI